MPVHIYFIVCERGCMSTDTRKYLSRQKYFFVVWIHRVQCESWSSAMTGQMNNQPLWQEVGLGEMTCRWCGKRHHSNTNSNCCYFHYTNVKYWPLLNIHVLHMTRTVRQSEETESRHLMETDP